MIKLEPRSFWVSCQEGASYMALERTRLQHKNVTSRVMVEPGEIIWFGGRPGIALAPMNLSGVLAKTLTDRWQSYSDEEVARVALARAALPEAARARLEAAEARTSQVLRRRGGFCRWPAAEESSENGEGGN